MEERAEHPPEKIELGIVVIVLGRMIDWRAEQSKKAYNPIDVILLGRLMFRRAEHR